MKLYKHTIKHLQIHLTLIYQAYFEDVPRQSGGNHIFDS